MLMENLHASAMPVALQAQAIDIEAFDAHIADFDGAVLEMTALFSQNRWPDTDLHPWLYFLDGEAVAAALVMVKHMPLKLGKLAVVKWGPILASATNPNRQSIYQQAVAHLQAQYGQASGSMLSVMAHAESDPPLEAEKHLKEAGFKPHSRLLFPARYVVKVRLPDADQRKSFAQKWRYHLNKSEKEGLVFEVAGADQYPRFAKLYEAMTDRKKFPDFSAYDTLHYLMDWKVEALKPQLFFVTQNGEDVAGAVIFKAGRTAVYMYGATNDRALPLRAGYFMHARIISWLRDNTRTEWYDLGGTDGFHGLHQFKKGMVGTAGRIADVPPIGNFAGNLRGYLLGTFAYSARDTVQKFRRYARELLTRNSAKPDQGTPE